MNDTNMMENKRLEQNALKLSIVGAAVMAALGMFFAVLTRSEAIMLDGLFSLIAFAMGIVVLKVARLVERGDDEYFQFGYASFSWEHRRPTSNRKLETDWRPQPETCRSRTVY